MSVFESLGLESKIIQAITELGFENPMPIQEKVIPHILQDECADIVALAQTGTGKTAAFGLPLIQRTDLKAKKTQHLIVSPTRELCLQIAEDLENYAKYKEDLKIVAVFGGSSVERQIAAIKRGAHIISATPGRLIDLIERGVVDISKVKSVVLDEADEMLNMGFRDDIERILQETPSEKNVFLFSATMPNEVRSIANNYMKNPIELTVGKRNSGAENVNHIYYLVQQKDRYLALKRVVDFHPDIYGIVFCRTRKETQEVADLLLKDGYNAEALHGDLSQAQRDMVMNKFRSKHLRILVATDVAARGLDVDKLTHVINYNLPDELEVYTHRSGRTGRAGKKGTSIAIVNVKEKNKIKSLEKQLSKKFENFPVPNGTEVCERQLFYMVDQIEKIEVDYSEIDPLLPKILKKLELLDRDELIKKFVSVEFNRFINYYKNAPDLNIRDDFQNKKKNKSGADGFTRYFINIGQTDKVKPVRLIEMITEYTGLRSIEIGDIEILRNFSFFEVESGYEEQLLNAFKNRFLKNRQINLEVSNSRKSESSSRSRDDGERSDRSDNRGGDRRRGSYGGDRDRGERKDKRFGDRSDNRGSDRERSSDRDREREPKKEGKSYFDRKESSGSRKRDDEKRKDRKWSNDKPKSDDRRRR